MPKRKLPYKNFNWTSELACAGGLIATEGNLSNDGYHIIMRSAERKMLKTFRSCLNLKNKNKIGISYNDDYSKKST